MNRQAGFTLVELVVVIIILGILAATALPRFMNVQDDAHSAAVAGAGGGLGSGVTMARAQWVANGITGPVTNVGDFGADDVDVNANGWPVGTTSDNNAIASDAHCVEVWQGVMQNPPTVEELPGGAATPTSDYTAENTAGQTCEYVYQGDGSGSMDITYNALTGEVVVTN